MKYLLKTKEKRNSHRASNPGQVTPTSTNEFIVINIYNNAYNNSYVYVFISTAVCCMHLKNKNNAACTACGGSNPFLRMCPSSMTASLRLRLLCLNDMAISDRSRTCISSLISDRPKPGCSYSTKVVSYILPGRK